LSHNSVSQDTKPAAVTTPIKSDSQTTNKTSTTPQLEDTSENIYDVPPVESTADDIYDVPPSMRSFQDDIQDQGGEIYDTPARVPIANVDTPNDRSEALYDATKLQPTRNRHSADGSERSSGGSEASGVKQRSSSIGKRGSSSSSGSGKVSSEDDDYVDYQEIYGFGRGKPVNLYDVPVQVSIF
jgi:hypothetical protein